MASADSPRCALVVAPPRRRVCQAERSPSARLRDIPEELGALAGEAFAWTRLEWMATTLAHVVGEGLRG